MRKGRMRPDLRRAIVAMSMVSNVLVYVDCSDLAAVRY